MEFVLCSDGEADRFFAMELDGCTLRYNCYRFTFTPPRPKLYFYYFQVTVENGVCHLIQANQQMLGELGLHSDRYWQLTVYDPQARRPAAFGSGILYQIFPDRFCNSGRKSRMSPPTASCAPTGATCRSTCRTKTARSQTPTILAGT